MGYFPANATSSTTLFLLEMPWMKRLRKLDRGYFAGNYHIVMIGDENTGKGAVVDAFPMASSWSINYSYLDASLGKFDDIAITDSFVVATSVSIVFYSSFGRVWYFNKPSTSGGALFQNYNKYYNVSCTPIRPMLIQRGVDQNSFFVAAAQGLYFNVMPIKIYTFNGTLCESTTLLSTSTRQSILEDLSFDDFNNVLEVLVYNKMVNDTNVTWKSVVYNTYPYSTTSPKTVYGHSALRLTSVSPKLYNGFVTCGIGSGTLLMHRYQLNTWVCPSKVKATTTYSGNSNDPLPQNFFERLSIIQVPQEYTAAYKEETATKTCD